MLKLGVVRAQIAEQKNALRMEVESDALNSVVVRALWAKPTNVLHMEVAYDVLNLDV